MDEIGELSLSTQAKLLRVLQEKEILKVGSNKPKSIDVRIISATNVDLEKAITEKRFRQDLYYRLNVVPIDIPALRKHKSDIPALVKFLINKYNQEYGRNVSDISSAAMERIMAYDWIGNVRELENFIGRSMINIKMHEHLLTLSHLPSILFSENSADIQLETAPIENDNANLDKNIQMFEKAFIGKILEKYNGSREDAAKALNISLRTLYYKIKKLEL